MIFNLSLFMYGTSIWCSLRKKLFVNFVLFTPAVYFPETILQEQYQTHLAI